MVIGDTGDVSDLSKAIGAAVTRLRWRALLSKETVAHGAAITEERLEAIERGEIENLRLHEALRLSASLHTTLQELVDEAALP